MAKAIPTDEELLSLDAVPSDEELLALDAQPSAAPSPSTAPMIEAPKMGDRIRAGIQALAEPMGAIGEFAKEAASTATFGLSDVAYTPMQGAGALVDELLGLKEYDKAATVVQRLQKNIADAYSRTQAYKAEHPYLTGIAAGTGAAAQIMSGIPTLPMGEIPLSEAGTVGTKELLKFSGKEGAKAGALMGSAHELTKQIAYPQEPGAAATETIAGTALSAGAGAGMGMGGTMLMKAAEPLLKMAAPTGKVTQGVLRIITGLPKETQERYLNMFEVIDRLQSPAEISAALEIVNNEMQRVVANKEKNYQEAVKLLEQAKVNLEKRKAEFDKTQVTEKEYLREEIKNLKTSEEEKQVAVEKDLAKEIGNLEKKQKYWENEKSFAVNELKETLKDPDLSTQEQPVVDAKVALQAKMHELSQRANDTLKTDDRVPVDELLKAVDDVANSLNVKGTSSAVLLNRKVKASLLKFKREILNLREPIGEEVIFVEGQARPKFVNELSGEQLKSLLNALDGEITSKQRGSFWGDVGSSAFGEVRKKFRNILGSKFEQYNEAIAPVAELAKFFEQVDAQTKSGSAIKALMSRARDEAVSFQLLKRLSDESGINVIDSVVKMQANKEFLRKNNFDQAVQALPAARELQRIQDLIETARNRDFEEAVISSVKDPWAQEKILMLQQRLEEILKPSYRMNKIEKLEQEGLISIQEAQLLRDQAKADLEEMDRIYSTMSGVPKGGQMLARILRNKDRVTEEAAATRLIDGLMSLPEPILRDFLNRMNLQSADQIPQMMEAMRVDASMSAPRFQGSKYQVMSNKVASMLERVMPGESWVKSLAMMGGHALAIMDVTGGYVAKQVLKAGAKMQGLPTINKFLETLPFNADQKTFPAVYTAISKTVGKLSEGVADTMLTVVPEQISFVENDIQRSNISPLEKAKAITSLRKFGLLDGNTALKVMWERAERPQRKVRALLMTEKDMALDADKKR